MYTMNNIKLLLVLLILSGLICLKLYLQASLDGNWKGFYLSSLHVVLVAAASYLGLRMTEADKERNEALTE